jgi:serine/threonine protein kinase
MRKLAFIRPLGSGAVGTVYLADMVSGRGFRRQVAVKVLMGAQPGAEQFLTRMRDEARLLGLLNDERILEVSELVRVASRDAVIMEFVEGIDLATVVEAGQVIPARALAEIGAMVAGALHKAHVATHPSSGAPLGVIHRDVKPANVMVTVRGSVKLLDFGVARAHFEARESYTGQLVLGTLNYMAPEYIVTGEVTPAADIYGLGIALFEAASGHEFGQPRIRRERFESAVEEALVSIRDSHGALIPIFERMLLWDPTARPDGQTLERELMAAADELRGSSLRSWASSAIPPLLADASGAPEDPIGLAGQEFEISTGGSEQTMPFGPLGASAGLDGPVPPAQAPAPASDPSRPAPGPIKPAPRTLPSSPAVAAPSAAQPPTPPAGSVPATLPLPIGPNEAGSPRPVSPPASKPSAAPPRPPTRRKRKRGSNLGLAIKSLLIGAGIGFILVVVAALILLGS